MSRPDVRSNRKDLREKSCFRKKHRSILPACREALTDRALAARPMTQDFKSKKRIRYRYGRQQITRTRMFGACAI